MVSAWLLALTLTLQATPKRPPAEPQIRLCELPSDCGPKGVCVGFMCRTGADQALVEVLHSVAVLPAVVSPAATAVEREARRLTARLAQDLGWSGFYAVKPETEQAGFSPTWLKEGASPAEIRRVSWQALGLGRLVMTAVGKKSDGSFEVRVRAVDIERWSVIDLPEGRATLAPGAPETDIARISNGWVNALVGYDTGIPASLGSRIVGSTETKSGVKEIAIVGSDGVGWTQLTQNGSLNLQAAWGPGGKVGWMSYVAGNADWWVDACSAAPARQPTCAKPFSTRPGLNAGGAWSPDGRYLALSVAETGDSELILIDGKDGEEEARLTDHPALDTSPAWSPDGKRLAFVSDRVANNPQIFVLSLDGGPLEQVTHEGYNAGPEWSPNGQSLLFVRQSGNDFIVMRYDFGTGEVRRLTSGKGSAESPTFSPDGRYIAYALTIDKVTRLWIMNADGQNPRAVGGDCGDKSFSSPAWERHFDAKVGK